MADNSNSENDKKKKETIKPQSRKGKRRKSPDRVMQDIMKKANIAHDFEKHLGPTHDLMKVMQERATLSYQIENNMRYNLSEMLGLNSIIEAATLANERSRDIIQSAAAFYNNELIRFQNPLMTSVKFTTFKDIIGDLHEKYAWIESLKINPLENALEKIGSTRLLDLRDIFKVTSEIKRIYEDIPDGEVLVVDDQTIICDEKEYPVSELKNAIDERLESAGFFNDRVTRKDFDKLRHDLKQIKETSLQKILWILIAILLNNLLTSPSENIKPNVNYNFSISNRTYITKIIQKEIPKEIDNKYLLRTLRFVNKDSLDVRIIYYQRSRLLWTLHLGDVVRVIKRKKSCTLIEWSDQENDLRITGWVFSRYLKKFKF